MSEIEKSAEDHFILLADDNKSEIFLFSFAARSSGQPVHIKSLDGGRELLEYLKNKENLLPSLIFLDLNMPMISGKDCLEEIRADKRLSGLPVVIYSTSDAPDDIDDCYRLGANLYAQKPSDPRALVAILNTVIGRYRKDGLKHTDKSNFFIK